MVLFFCIISAALYWYLPARQYEQARLRIEAESLRTSRLLVLALAPAVEFEDSERINGTLQSLHTDERIQFVAVFAEKGAQLAAYDTKQLGHPLPEISVLMRETGELGTFMTQAGASLRVVSPTTRNEKTVGTIVVDYSLRDLNLEVAETRETTMLVCMVVLGLGLLFSVLLGRAIAGPIIHLTTAVQSFDADNLDTRIEVRSSGEVGRLAAAFNEMAGRLEGARAAEKSSLAMEKRARGAVVDTSEKLLETSNHILAATTQQAAGAQQQVAAVTEAVATVKEVNQTAEEAANRATMVSDSSREALDVGRAGREAIEETILSMGAIKEQVESIAEGILELAERAQAIGDIVTSVNEIAEQTNLLALNAAIEASRAGEHGRGFSVVASEVKELASQSKKATAQIRQILVEIQQATNSAVMATEVGTKQVGEAVQIVHGTGDTIRTLVATVEGAAEAAAQIAASAGQQASGMTHISIAMKNINQVANENLNSTEQAERAARELNELAETLRQLLVG